MAGMFNATARGASGGLSRLAQALSGGNAAEQQAYDGALQGQSRIGLALAQMAAQRAAANAHDAQAAETQAKTGILSARPAAFEEQIAATAGTDIPTVRAWRQSLQTGRAPQIELAGPATPDGGALMGDVQIAPDQRSKLAQALQRMMPIATSTGDIKADDWAKALDTFRGQDLGDQVLAGTRTAGDVGRSQAAVGGKPLYHFDTSGLVGDLFGGGLNESSGRAQAVTGKERAQGTQATAAANASNASAELHRAQRDEVKNGPKGVLVQTDSGPVFADPRSGAAMPVTINGKPVSGASKPLTDAQAKALLFGTRMQEANKVLEGLDYSPAAVNAKLTAENLPMIGGPAGMVGNALLSEQGQQAEQAQRDFINAVLRRESGAVISDSEFSNAKKQYFPQPNDKPEMLKQKARNRKLAINGLLAEVPEGQRQSITPKSDANPAAKTVVRTGSLNGRKVVQYSDGTTDYAD